MQPISRVTDHGIEVLDAFTFPVPSDVRSHAVAYSLTHVVYATATDVVCVDLDGRELWRLPLVAGDRPADCIFSTDDTLVWVYCPDAMNGGGPDRWLALDAATGLPRVEHLLPTSGEGGQQFATSGGRHVLLCVGEGQDGQYVFRADPELHAYEWTNRVLVDVAPDGTGFMTADHGQGDVAFHRLPDGVVQARTRVDRFGGDDETYVEWTGGYLDAGTAIAAVGGDLDDEEWWRYHRVDVRTGEVLGELAVATIDVYDLRPLGDGTFLITDTDGTLRRL